MSGLMICVRSLNLTQEGSNEAEEGVACQKETFLQSFLSLCVRDVGPGFFSLLLHEKFSRDCFLHTDPP